MQEVKQSFTKNFGTINAQTENDMVCTFTGDAAGIIKAANLNWFRVAWPNAGLPAGIADGGQWCTADDTVTVRLCNYTGGNVVVGSLTFILTGKYEE